MNISEIMDRILALCAAYSAKEVYLFGSRAKGTATERSDFDIAVTGVTDVEGLRDAFDRLPTLYQIDVVDLDTCKNTFLLEDIKQYGRKIYPTFS